MKDMGTGGQLIPDRFRDAVIEVQWSDNLYRSALTPLPPVKWTWRLRFRMWRDRVRWAIHNRLFPECPGD